MSESPSYASDVKPLFREEDQKAMDYILDLWDYEDVKENAEAILERVQSGSMPCDSTWEREKVDLLRQWMQAGMPE